MGYIFFSQFFFKKMFKEYFSAFEIHLLINFINIIYRLKIVCNLHIGYKEINMLFVFFLLILLKFKRLLRLFETIISADSSPNRDHKSENVREKQGIFLT